LCWFDFFYFVFGRYDHVPIDEKTRKSPLNFHGKAKSMAEDVLDFFGPTLPAASLLALRIFNVYGPGQDPRFVVPGLFRQIRASVSSSAGASSSLCKVAVSDPLVVRDFVFIDDVVGLYAALLAQRHTLQPGFQALNIGSGQGTSLSSLIEQVSH
jgi:GDP-4-dehydro-6-deoxy-D-mannose reductase